MRHWFLLHAGVFAVALLVRLGLAAAFVGLAAPPKGDANPDQLDYELFAYNLSTGHEFISFVLAPVYALFGRSFLAGRVWFCLLSAACCPVAGWIATRLAGPRTGLLAAAWLAVYPGQAYYAVHFLSETPITLLTGLAVAFHSEGLRRPPGWADVLAGLAWGLGALVRPNLAAAAALAVLITLVAGTAARRSRALKAALVAAAATLVVGPWVVRNAVVMGKPGICTIVGGYTFWGAYNPRVADNPDLWGYWVPTSSLADAEHPLKGTEGEREARAWQYGRDFVAEHPDRLPVLKLHALLRVLWAYPEAGNRAADLAFRAGWIVSLPFVAIGLVGLARRARTGTLYLLTPLAAVLATAVIFYGCSRFRDGAAPVLAVFAAAGMAAVWGQISPALAKRPRPADGTDPPGDHGAGDTADTTRDTGVGAARGAGASCAAAPDGRR
jgi:4-amino-4-deoxy-L-arabinose transferase-like glycosyltransferase